MSDTDIQFHSVADSSAVDEGEVIQVSVGRTDIAVYRLDGEVYATDDVCTHAYASLADGYVDDGQIECPLHGACFDIKTGKALSAPANVDLRTYPVKIEGDKILVGVAAATG